MSRHHNEKTADGTCAKHYSVGKLIERTAQFENDSAPARGMLTLAGVRKDRLIVACLQVLD